MPAICSTFNHEVCATGAPKYSHVSAAGRTSTQVETAAADLDWLNKGIFIGVAGRQPGGVIYETYLVG
jgi:hypothetical protein